MKRDLLAYYQEVLDKISQADAKTFRKEMRKAFNRLMPEEREQLKKWFRSACVCRVDQERMSAIPTAQEINSFRLNP